MERKGSVKIEQSLTLDQQMIVQHEISILDFKAADMSIPSTIVYIKSDEKE